MNTQQKHTDEAQTTKARILEVALQVFADQGFEGASIRTISQEAKVNVAAINYHFGNKENLYFEVVRHSYFEMDQRIQQLAGDGSMKVEDLVVAIFDLFASRGPMLVNTFRMMLSGKEVFERLREAGSAGPPGGMALAKTIGKNIPGLTQEDLFWAVRTLFSLIIHQSIIFCARPDVPLPMKPSKDEVRTGLSRAASVVMGSLSQRKK